MNSFLLTRAFIVCASAVAADSSMAGKQAEAIDVGERGHPYGGASMSETAATAGGRAYHFRVSSLERCIGDKKDAVIQIRKKVIG